MSLIIPKSDEKTSQPKLYKRGAEDINLDTFSNEATITLLNRLANSRLKDKEKEAVLKEFSRLLEGMYNGTVTYKIGGGYDNSIGIVNAPKGFDAAGVAAGILGDVLRNLDVYTTPEKSADSSKITWNGNSSIGSAITRRLFGNDTVNAQDFIGLDYDPSSKKVTGNAQRSSRFKLALEYVRDNFDNLFTSYTDPDKVTALENIDLAIKGFSDNILTDNEYLDLSRAVGMSNLRLLFGNTYESPSDNSKINPKVTPDKAVVYTNEDEWRKANHPRSTASNLLNKSLETTAMYQKSDRLKLNQILWNLPKENLLNLVRMGISNPQLDLNKGKSILKGFGYLTSFENNFILRQALEVLRRREYIKPIAENSNLYYLPYDSDRLTQRGTGIIYSISPNGTRSLIEMDRNDIPQFADSYHKEFISQVPSNRNGGRLRKFQPGGKASGILKFNPKRNNIYYTGDFTGYDNWHASNIILPWLNAYENAGDQDWETLIKSGLDSWNNAGGFDWYNATDELRKHGMQSSGTQAHQLYVIDNLPGLNTEIAKHTANYNVPTKANTDDRFVNGTLKGTDTDFGIQTGNRRPSIHINTSGKDLTDWDAFYQNLGYVGRYLYLDHWVPTKNTNQEGLVSFTTKENPAISDRKATVASTQSPDAESEKELSGDKTTPDKDPDKNSVAEKTLPTPNTNIKTGSLIGDLVPNLIGAGRLWASLHTNNNVYKTLLPSLKPVLKDTYEKYSPVTGAFSQKQYLENRGSLVLRQASQPFTSDASLASARILEGQRQANELSTQGFLADDKEIKRTQTEALARQEDNMARRSEVANFNRASINQTNRERAQLEATRLKSNWQSWDNFLQGIESRTRTRLDENRERANSFYDKLATDQAERWYNTVMEPANLAYSTWQKNNPNADPTTEWKGGREWRLYLKFKEEARARANSMIYLNMADRYGLHYTNPYKEESNTIFNWDRRYL